MGEWLCSVNYENVAPHLQEAFRVVVPGDNSMINQAARGAWRSLELKLRPFVARRLRSEADVDDVVQDVLLRMHRGLAELRDDDSFGGWTYQIARSAIADHLRAAAKQGSLAEGLEREEIPDGQDEDTSARDVLAASLGPFIAALPHPYREALVLAELKGLSQKQAAEMVGTSLSGMKSRIQRGRRLIRKSLGDCCRIALDGRGKVLSFEIREDGRFPNGCCERTICEDRAKPCVLSSVPPSLPPEMKTEGLFQGTSRPTRTGEKNVEPNKRPSILNDAQTAHQVAAASACCAPEKKATCCEQGKKDACCGPKHEGSGGCC